MVGSLRRMLVMKLILLLLDLVYCKVLTANLAQLLSIKQLRFTSSGAAVCDIFSFGFDLLSTWPGTESYRLLPAPVVN